MSRCIIKIKDKYFEWSTIIDAPVTNGMDKEKLKEYITNEYGNSGLRKLPFRLERVEEKGASWASYHDLDYTLTANRAGEDEKCISKDEIYEKYTN